MIREMIAAECRRERFRLASAGAAAALVGASSVALLGLSGWFITASAFASATAYAFNTLLPAATIRLLAIARTGARYAERLQGHDGVLRAFARVRPALFTRMAAGDPARALALRNGDAVARFVDDVSELEQSTVLEHTSAWTAGAATVVGLVLLCLAGGGMVAASVALLLAIMRVVASGLERRACRSGRGLPAARGRLREAIGLLCQATAEIRVYELAGWMYARITHRSAEMMAAQKHMAGCTARLGVLQAVVSGVAGVLALVLVLDAGATRHAGPRHMVEMAVLCALAAGMTVEAAGGGLRGRERRAAAFEAAARLEQMAASDTPPPAARPAASPARQPSLDWLDGTAPASVGTIIGLIGPSGCGKTTLLEQMVALRRAPPGRLAVGGCDLHDLGAADARACFAYSPQDAAILVGTVRDNLRLGLPSATDEQMWEALRDAALDACIRSAPAGLDTWLGTTVALSGGEMRRLALARAYLRDAPWLLLDEPTENLDAATEAEIIRRLRTRLARTGQGALIVSHRPAWLAICDVVRHVGRADGAGLDVLPNGERPAIPTSGS